MLILSPTRVTHNNISVNILTLIITKYQLMLTYYKEKELRKIILC